MALLDLKTDLKSLKYGQDRPDGGSSNQPYIKTDINNIDRAFNQIRLTKFDEGLIRGGVIGSTNAALTDTLRIGKFLTDVPRGPLFIVKQVGLQLSNPRLETRKLPTTTGFLGTVAKLANTISSIIPGPTRIYNLGINTLAQVPINHLGGHIVRHGLLPVQNENTKYEAVVTDNNKNGNNRLIKLYNNFNKENANTTLKKSNKYDKFINSVASILTNKKIDFSSLVIDSYLGGPDSTYGIGTTLIRSYAPYTRTKEEGDKDKKNPSKTTIGINYINTLGVSSDYFTINYPNDAITTENNISNDGSTITYPATIKYSPNSTTAVAKYIELQKQITDQQQLSNSNKIVSIPSGSSSVKVDVNQFGIYDTDKKSYSSTNIETIGYKNSYNDVITIKTGGSWNTISREYRIGSGRKDLINLTPLFNGTQPGNSVYIDGKKYLTRDLIKFRIGAINTDKPDDTVWMVFRAYLKGFSDSFTSEWNDTKYVGRGEKFHIYNGFTRQVTFNFKVAALSKQEMEPMYQKLNYLASNMMPDYKGVLMRGPLMRVTVGDYLNAQPGIITSLQYSIADDTPWEISLDQPEGGSTMYDLPHIIDVSVTFIPIGVNNGELPQKGESTPVMLQSGMIVDGQTNPWLKKKDPNTGKYIGENLISRAGINGVEYESDLIKNNPTNAQNIINQQNASLRQ